MMMSNQEMFYECEKCKKLVPKSSRVHSLVCRMPTQFPDEEENRQALQPNPDCTQPGSFHQPQLPTYQYCGKSGDGRSLKDTKAYLIKHETECRSNPMQFGSSN